MKKIVSIASIVSIFAMLLLAGMAVAKEAKTEESGATDFYFEDESGPVFYITLPETWKGEWQEEDGLAILHAMSNDEEVYLSILAAEEATPENIGNIADAVLAEMVTGQSFKEWEEVTINNIPLYTSESKAKLKDGGEKVDVSVAYFTPKKDATYILYIIGATDAQEAHGEDVGAILNSLRTKE